MLKTGDSGVREMKKIKVITLFTGIGAQEAALKRLGIDYEVVGISEIDKYAIQSYESINGSTYNYGDITKIGALDYADLWTYSSPCQDFSTAGKQQGIRNADGSLTRSGLLLHVERLLVDSVIRGDNPKYLLMENVKGLVSKKFKPDFDRWLERLEQLGYNNYWQVLNAKDYGVPQNRERVFVVSIRKDLNKTYTFPSKQELKIRLKDILESNVEEKYYLSDDMVNKFIARSINKSIEGSGFRFKPHNPSNAKTAFAITTKAGGRMDDNFVFDKDISNDGYVEFNKDFINEPTCVANSYRIRKLTPRECWRLMGFTDVEFDCAQMSGISNAQLYKQAGNSIVVDVLAGIFKELLS